MDIRTAVPCVKERFLRRQKNISLWEEEIYTVLQNYLTGLKEVLSRSYDVWHVEEWNNSGFSYPLSL
jgi:hypothetical protein